MSCFISNRFITTFQITAASTRDFFSQKSRNLFLLLQEFNANQIISSSWSKQNILTNNVTNANYLCFLKTRMWQLCNFRCKNICSFILDNYKKVIVPKIIVAFLILNFYFWTYLWLWWLIKDPLDSRLFSTCAIYCVYNNCWPKLVHNSLYIFILL